MEKKQSNVSIIGVKDFYKIEITTMINRTILRNNKE